MRYEELLKSEGLQSDSEYDVFTEKDSAKLHLPNEDGSLTRCGLNARRLRKGTHKISNAGIYCTLCYSAGMKLPGRI